MNTPTLLCGGLRLQLGDPIGRGGEGEVLAINDGSNRAVKIYLRPDAAREAKIGAIVQARLGGACPNVAFPLDMVRGKDGRFAGFTMGRVTNHQPIHELLGTGSRRQFFPQADWKFQVRVAVNVARIVARVHAANVVIGDINSAGFLVSQQATVTLIDADSFQVGAHRCRVGMPEYTPPELQGVHFPDCDRTPDHDAFGLAVILFQLLSLGRHPHAGVPRGRSVPLEMAIKLGAFPIRKFATLVSIRRPARLAWRICRQAFGFCSSAPSHYASALAPLHPTGSGSCHFWNPPWSPAITKRGILLPPWRRRVRGAGSKR